LAIKLGLRYDIFDLHSKSEEDRTKTAVAIVDDRQTDMHSSDFISVQRHALQWTCNKIKYNSKTTK